MNSKKDKKKGENSLPVGKKGGRRGGWWCFGKKNRKKRKKGKISLNNHKNISVDLIIDLKTRKKETRKEKKGHFPLCEGGRGLCQFFLKKKREKDDLLQKKRDR